MINIRKTLLQILWIIQLLENVSKAQRMIRLNNSGNVNELETSLRQINAVSSNSMGLLCVTKQYGPIKIKLDTKQWNMTKSRTNMAASVISRLGYDNKVWLDAICRGILEGDDIDRPVETKLVVINRNTGSKHVEVYWRRPAGEVAPFLVVENNQEKTFDGSWYADSTKSNYTVANKYMTTTSDDNNITSHWSYPYYSCNMKSWFITYSVDLPVKYGFSGVLLVNINISNLEINQCNANTKVTNNEITAFYGTHKCPDESTKCWYNGTNVRWSRGNYMCVCRDGYYSLQYPDGINGSLVEVAYGERGKLKDWYKPFECIKCEPGCVICNGPTPCLAYYNWPFRISLLVISICCAVLAIVLAVYTHHHRRAKVFRVASPVFLSITLFGCVTMYMEMAAIFPILDRYSCIATKWTRHMGFCITYTSLLMKTWRVSLTYRVKSAHKLKLTDNQLLQWMAPVILIMLVYLGTWSLSSPPDTVDIVDNHGLKFKQCAYNWWDHSLAIGEMFFLLWGVRVCYSVRHAETLYNEASHISFAIYNITTVNLIMIAFHLFIFSNAGPDIKYLLGFIRTQLSTSTTILLVFAPKVIRILQGNGDTWESRASASLNGVSLVTEEPLDLYQENEELKEEIQKLASQLEHMKIAQMHISNRHLKSKPGGYFQATLPFTSQAKNNRDSSGPA